VVLSRLLILVSFEALAIASGPTVGFQVRSESYCFGPPGGPNVEHLPPGAITLRLRGSLFYDNSGSTPLIVPRHPRLRAIVVETSEEAGQRRVPLVIDYKYRADDPHPALKGPGTNEPNKNFEIIEPHLRVNNYSRAPEEYIVLRVDKAPDSPNADSLLGKTIKLQFEFDYNLLSAADRLELSAKWITFGDLWTGSIRTTPIEIKIPSHPTFADCSREYSIDLL
jgi:hypothetical protein